MSSKKHKFWSSWNLHDLVAETKLERQKAFNQRIDALIKIYVEISDIYQKKKAEGTGADVPFAIASCPSGIDLCILQTPQINRASHGVTRHEFRS